MKKFSFLITALIFFWALQSCEDPTNIGQSIIPEDDQLKVNHLIFTDFIANSIEDDTIFTSFRNTIYLGEINHSVFGSCVANYYTELAFPNSYEVANNPIVDSAILYLKTSGFSGYDFIAQDFEVLTLQDSIPSDSLFVASKGFQEALKIGEFTDVVYSEDEVTIDGISNIPPHIRAYIDLSFAQNLLNRINSGSIHSTQTLQNYLKGLAIKPKEGNNGQGLFSIDMNFQPSTNFSGLSIYYSTTEADSLFVQFSMFPFFDAVTNDGEEISGVYNQNQFVTDYEEFNPVLQNQLDNYSQSGYEEAFLQSGSGVITELLFPSLKEYIQANERINSAKLIIRPEVENPRDTIFLPRSLLLFESFQRDEVGNKTGRLIGIDGRNLPDINNERRFDLISTALLIKDENGDYNYTFNLPNFVEYVKNDEIEPKLYLSVNNGEFSTSAFYTSVSRSKSFNGIKFDVLSSPESDIYFDIIFSENN